jgi:hypothetical protein
MAKSMSGTVGCGGHHEPSKAPSLNKGQFQQVGTFVDEGQMTSVSPRGTSVNSKTGKLQNGEN